MRSLLVARVLLLSTICIVSVAWPGVVAVQAQTPLHPEPVGFRCSLDRKVWVNSRSRVYQLHGERYYGSTINGVYLCEGQARAEGDRRETRNGQ